MKSKVGIIILNWNSSRVTIECLESLAGITYSDFHIFLVDNASEKPEYDCIADYCNDNPFVSLISLAYNYGFAGGNNIGMRIAWEKYRPDYFLLLNNDTLVNKDFLGNLVGATLQHENTGIAVPKIFFYEPAGQLYYAGGYINKLSGMGEHYGWKQKDNNKYNISRKVTFANGCCMLISNKLWQSVGDLNRDFFANIEDVEYSYRCTKAGFGIIYVPVAIIMHKEGYASRRNKGQWFRIYLSTRNLILFYKERTEWYKPILFLPYLTVRWVAYMTFKLILLRDRESVKALFKGVSDGVRERLSFVDLPKEIFFRSKDN